MGAIYITAIYAPESEEDWFLFKTSENLVYSFRLGGVRKEINENIDFFDYTMINQPDYVNVRLLNIYTDDFWVYMVLGNGNIISSGTASIDSEGLTSFGLLFQKSSDFEEDFFVDDDFKEIMLD